MAAAPLPIYYIREYGAENTAPPAAFQSKEEQILYYALIEVVGQNSFIFQWKPYGGDSPYTAGRDELSADFALPASHLVLNPTSPFTHPDPMKDQEYAEKFADLGYRVIFIPDYDIRPEMGGDVYKTLISLGISGLLGQAPKQATRFGEGVQFGQPARDVTFSKFSTFKAFG